MIENNFEEEFNLLNTLIPFKEIFTNDERFRDLLLKDFKKSPAKPNLQLFIKERLSKNEYSTYLEERLNESKQNWDLESTLFELIEEFEKAIKMRTLPKEFYSPKLQDTFIVKKLIEINKLFEELKKYCFFDPNIDNYQNKARIFVSEIISLLGDLKNKDLGISIIEKIIESSIELDFTQNLKLMSYDVKEQEILIDKFAILKRLLDTELKKALESDYSKKSNGPEELLLSLNKIEALYRLCILEDIFEEQPINLIDFTHCFDLQNIPKHFPKFSKGMQVRFCYILAQTKVSEPEVLRQFGIKNYRFQKSRALKNSNIKQVFRNQIQRIINPSVKLS